MIWLFHPRTYLDAWCGPERMISVKLTLTSRVWPYSMRTLTGSLRTNISTRSGSPSSPSSSVDTRESTWCWRAVLWEPRSMLTFHIVYNEETWTGFTKSLCLTSRWDRTSGIRWDRCQVEHRVPGMNIIFKSRRCDFAKLIHFGRDDNWCLETVGLDECWDYHLLCVWTVEERVDQMFLSGLFRLSCILF